MKCSKVLNEPAGLSSGSGCRRDVRVRLERRSLFAKGVIRRSGMRSSQMARDGRMRKPVNYETSIVRPIAQIETDKRRDRSEEMERNRKVGEKERRERASGRTKIGFG